MTFTCHSDGSPSPTLVLRKGEEELAVSDSASSLLNFSLPSALLEDSALYRCEASNLYDSQMVSSSVTVRGTFTASEYFVF